MDVLLLIGSHALALVVGYVARKYVGKRWPNAEEALDVVAKEYGERAELAVKRARQRAGR
jgi:hypothetical protein